MTPQPPARRYDLDWLRIIAFGLLIFYHIGMFYVTWDWHVKSPHSSTWAEPLMLITRPWRLDLLFLISGVGARFMLDKMSLPAFSGSRFNRLFWPLLFAMFVIVPPQAYYELIDAVRLGQIPSFSDDYATFYLKYASGFEGWCDAGGCLSVPTWNHMWFVAYLLVYSLLIALLWPLLKRLKGGWPVWTFIMGPWLIMWGLRATLFPIFGDTHGLTDDFYLHALYGFLFVLGALIAKSERLFEAARKGRWIWLCAATLAYALYMPMALWSPGDMSPIAMNLLRGAREAQAWFAILALIGFARQHLSGKDGPLRRTLTEAIFPFYLVHQTIIVVAAYNLAQQNLPVGLEFAILVAITAGGCLLTYLIVRAIPPLRPLFGLPLRRRDV
ncbi:acyltransferase family protein [Asticcacaulis sp. AND118]|uniref:acyltransferase family protein n=1 Tax=Asticcacaulis sp. AND118 TaxID=2840468 RepID=UPI001D0006B6|nr:acyltransferase family protein [Asticcacaulis sp. AND118]UDF05192.1 acyltransferase family protein [Asticcacaulis sp. AND118]